MGSILGSKPKQDPDQKALLAEQRAKLKEQKAEIEARRYTKRKGTMGRQSLISGAETGVQGSPSTQPTRTTLG